MPYRITLTLVCIVTGVSILYLSIEYRSLIRIVSTVSSESSSHKKSTVGGSAQCRVLLYLRDQEVGVGVGV